MAESPDPSRPPCPPHSHDHSFKDLYGHAAMAASLAHPALMPELAGFEPTVLLPSEHVQTPGTITPWTARTERRLDLAWHMHHPGGDRLCLTLEHQSTRDRLLPWRVQAYAQDVHRYLQRVQPEGPVIFFPLVFHVARTPLTQLWMRWEPGPGRVGARIAPETLVQVLDVHRFHGPQARALPRDNLAACYLRLAYLQQQVHTAADTWSVLQAIQTLMREDLAPLLAERPEGESLGHAFAVWMITGLWEFLPTGILDQALQDLSAITWEFWEHESMTFEQLLEQTREQTRVETREQTRVETRVEDLGELVERLWPQLSAAQKQAYRTALGNTPPDDLPTVDSLFQDHEAHRLPRIRESEPRPPQD